METFDSDGQLPLIDDSKDNRTIFSFLGNDRSFDATLTPLKEPRSCYIS
jgi:hypothetical protein